MSDVDPDWPPSTYFTTGTYGPVLPERLPAVTPLDGVQRKPDGTRFVRYQTPEAPLVPGSLRVAGYLRSLVDGTLLNPANNPVGTVDWNTGIFEVMVEYNQSPGLGSRVVEYKVGPPVIVAPPVVPGPEQLQFDDLDSLVGLELDMALAAGVVPGGPIEDTQSLVIGYDSIQGTLYSADGASNIYVDGASGPGQAGYLTIYRGANVPALNVPPHVGLRLKRPGLPALPLVRTGSIITPTPSSLALNVDYWIATDGRLYLAQVYGSVGQDVVLRPWATAISYPPA